MDFSLRTRMSPAPCPRPGSHKGHQMAELGGDALTDVHDCVLRCAPHLRGRWHWGFRWCGSHYFGFAPCHPHAPSQIRMRDQTSRMRAARRRYRDLRIWSCMRSSRGRSRMCMKNNSRKDNSHRPACRQERKQQRRRGQKTFWETVVASLGSGATHDLQHHAD